MLGAKQNGNCELLRFRLGVSVLRNTAVLSNSVSTLTGCLWDPRSILSIMLASPVG